MAGLGVKDMVVEVVRVDGADDVAAERQLHGALNGDVGQRRVAVFEDIDEGWDESLLIDVKVDEVGRVFLGLVVAALVGRGRGRCVEGSRHEVSVGGGVHG